MICVECTNIPKTSIYHIQYHEKLEISQKISADCRIWSESSDSKMQSPKDLPRCLEHWLHQPWCVHGFLRLFHRWTFWTSSLRSYPIRTPQKEALINLRQKSATLCCKTWPKWHPAIWAVFSLRTNWAMKWKGWPLVVTLSELYSQGTSPNLCMICTALSTLSSAQGDTRGTTKLHDNLEVELFSMD